MTNESRKKNNTGLANNALFLTGSKIVTLSISVVTGMLLSRYFSLEEYGTYSELMLAIALVVSVVSLGIPNSLNFFLPKANNQDEKDKYLTVYYFNITVISIVCGIILVIIIPLLVLFFGNNKISAYAFVLAVIPWTRIIIGGRSHMLVAVSRVKREVFYNILNSVCLLLIIIMTKVFRGNLLLYLILYVAVESFFCLAVYFEAGRLIETKKPFFDRQLIKQILAFSVPLGISTALGTLCTEIDKLMIGNFYAPDEVALYTNAGKELPFSYLSVSFIAIVLPKIVSLNHENRQSESITLWKKTAEFCFLIMAFCAAACVVFAPQIICILYSDKYVPATDIFRIYSVAIMLRITNFGLLLNANGKTRLVLINSIITLVANIILNYVLYVLLGFIGPALATVISLVISIVIQLWLTTREYGISFKNVMPWKKLLLIFMVNVFFAVVVSVILNGLKFDLSRKGILLASLVGLVWLAMYFLAVRKTIKKQLKEINSYR